MAGCPLMHGTRGGSHQHLPVEQFASLPVVGQSVELGE